MDETEDVSINLKAFIEDSMQNVMKSYDGFKSQVEEHWKNCFTGSIELITEVSLITRRYKLVLNELNNVKESIDIYLEGLPQDNWAKQKLTEHDDLMQNLKEIYYNIPGTEDSQEESDKKLQVSNGQR